MAIGSFMGRVFTVSHTKIFTPSNLKGSTGSDWATHEVVGGKARSEWVGPKLKSYTFDLLLRAQDGVPPRSTLDYFQRMAESRDWNALASTSACHGLKCISATRIPLGSGAPTRTPTA